MSGLLNLCRVRQGLVPPGRSRDEPAVADEVARPAHRQHARQSTRNRKVLFTELGYDRSTSAARRPWKSGRRGAEAGADLQRRCLETALRAIREDETVVGALLWKWFPGDARGENFLLSEPDVRGVIRQAWGQTQQR